MRTLSLLFLTACAQPVELPEGAAHGPLAMAISAEPKSVSTTSPTTLSGAGGGDFVIVPTVNGGSYDDVLAIVGSTPTLYYGTASGTSASASLTVSATVGANAVVAGIGDVNGDGYNDFAVGDPTASGGRGRVLVYHGAARNPSRRSVVSITGRGATDALGTEVAGLGDVNGDGYDDVAVYVAGPTRTRVYYGSASGLTTGAYTSISTSFHSMASITWTTLVATGDGLAGGDLNGDGYADLVVSYPTWNGEEGGFYYFLGSSSGISTTGTLVEYPWSGFYSTWCYGPPYMGWSVEVGDLNGDGRDDVAAGAPWDICYGYGYLWYGADSGVVESSWSEIMGYGATSYLGETLALGDFNADGIVDVGSGGSPANYTEAPFDVSDATNEVMMSPTPLTGTEGYYYDKTWGYRVSRAAGRGDVNNDGHDDMAIDVPDKSGDWQLYVYYGG